MAIWWKPGRHIFWFGDGTMHSVEQPIVKDIVLVGGGHSHVTVLKKFGMAPLPGVRLTVITPDAHTPYSGMLPGMIAGHYTFDEAHIDLGPLCRFASARFVRASVIGLDLASRQVFCERRPPIPYDLLSINSGSTPDPVDIPGALGRVIPVKPVSEFLVQWEALETRIKEQPRRRIGIVGAGAGGVEMVLSVQFALQSTEGGPESQPEFHLVTGDADILPTHNNSVRKTFCRILDERNVHLHTGFRVDRVKDDGVVSGDRSLLLDEIIWITGARPAPWLAESGLAIDDHGFMVVDRTLRSTSHRDIFGVGDIATMVGLPRPKSGVFAVRQGPPLENNLRRAARGQPLGDYRPQAAFLSLISTGDKYAVASRGRWSAEGAWVWKWKDWIDQRFMKNFNELPEMEPVTSAPALVVAESPEAQAELGAQDMRCGGCGAKVGAAILSNSLATLQISNRDDVLVGLDAPDDAAVIAVPPGKVIVQSVDAFRTMIDDPYVFGMIAANHCLGDLYAMGAEPQSALALASVPFGLRQKTEDTLTQMMRGATKILNEANCALVGGHTGEALELSLGFSVTGLIDAERVTRKAGMQTGDVLILTKPLGTGTLFAADMRGKAKGRWMQAAVETALQSNRDAARILREHGATASTDVTGFGLVGHLLEMITASGVAAALEIDAMPTIAGALETLGLGFVSSLQRENALRQAAIHDPDRFAEDPRFALLFDPQTAGGLLASVPVAAAMSCIETLREAGYGVAANVGRVVAISGGEPHIEIR